MTVTKDSPGAAVSNRMSASFALYKAHIRRKGYFPSTSTSSKPEVHNQAKRDELTTTPRRAKRQTEEHLSTSRPGHPPKSLDSLPEEILKRIFRFAPYEELLVLRRCNSFFNAKVPQLAPYENKVASLLCMEKKGRKRVSHPGSSAPSTSSQEMQMYFGCYLECFALLDPSRFADRDSLPEGLPTNHRRFCILCGVKKGYYAPGAHIVTLTRATVWVCDCSKLLSQYDYHCAVCNMHCPFSPQHRTKKARSHAAGR